jgi:hypothetical protein
MMEMIGIKVIGYICLKFKLLYIAFALCVIAMTACRPEGSQAAVDMALRAAGDNRGELEAVLNHYAGDPDKLAAAEFLIANMPGHYSHADAALMERYHQQADSFITANPRISIFDLCDSIDAIAEDMGVTVTPLVSDCRIMTAEYLIDNIDCAFEQWRGNPWLRHLDFDRFCEYVLPYKVKDLQPLDDWRSDFRDVYARELAQLEYCDLYSGSPYRACMTLNEAYRRDIHPGPTVPGWISRVEDGRIIDERLPKTFRATYAANPDLKRLNSSGEFVPAFFRNVFQRDVTDEYVATSDVEIDCSDEEAAAAYLCVYGDNDWTAVDYAMISGGKAKFSKIGRNIVYLPVTYSQTGVKKALCEPFILGYDGTVNKLAPGEACVNACLDRKYPVFKYVWDYAKLVENGEFEASDDPTFSRGVMKIHTIPTGRAVGGEIDVPDTVPALRYWRYINRLPDTYGSMAELSFYAGGSDEPMKGRVIGSEGSWENNSAWKRENLFDGDVLTSYCAPQGVGCWVGLDFGKPVKLSKIRYTPRGDGNMIEPGDEYELLYWADGHWRSLGRKVAETMSVSFGDIPEGALLLLRDRTKGHDERIFLLDSEGRQEWW